MRSIVTYPPSRHDALSHVHTGHLWKLINKGAYETASYNGNQRLPPCSRCTELSPLGADSLLFPRLVPTQCLQVCLSNVIYWSGIPSVPCAALGDSIIYTPQCRGLTLIHRPSSLIHSRACNFTFRCALLWCACTDLLHSALITNLGWNVLIRFIFLTPNVNLIENFDFPEDPSISDKL